MTAAAIELIGVRKTYGRIIALADVSLQFPMGRLTGFLGPNGAGKTTTFRTVLGLTRPEQGQVRILGTPITGSLPSLVKRLGAVVEEPGLHKTLNGVDNMRVAALTLGVGDGQIPELMDFVGLTDDAGRKVAGYSKGMRQRLALASALLGDPEVLILDEPLDGLDPAGQVTLKRQLRMLVTERDKTVIVSSHDLKDVEEMADHIVVLDRGRQVISGSLEEILGSAERHRVVVDRPEDAVRVLTDAGITAVVDAGQVTVDDVRGADIVRVLAAAGLYPDAVVPARITLESVFLDATEAR